MEKFKSTVLKLLYPPEIITFILIIASVAGLICVFANGMEQHPLACAAYMLSFYTLCVVVAAVPACWRKYKSRVYSNAWASKYLTEKELRMRTTLYAGTFLNLTYAVLKLLAGVHFKSVWIGAVAVYYMVVFVIRFLLVANDRRSRKFKTDDDRLLFQWKSYRICGVLMFMLNAAMTGMTVQMIWHNKGYSYPGLLIYAMATYTFYRLVMAIVNNVGQHKSKNPVLTAAKVMDLSVALMSVFSLQTAMFSAFGAELAPAVQRIMNSATGGFVCLSVMFIAVMMVINANSKISQLK